MANVSNLRILLKGIASRCPAWLDGFERPLNCESLIAALGRSGCLDCGDYLERYPDVAASGIDAVRHYALYGVKEGRIMSQSLLPANVDIVMPVYNGRDYLEACLNSICACTQWPFNIWIVDDRSDEPTASFIREAVKHDRRVHAIVNEHNLGYTKSINRGLKLGTAPYAILLNHDTLVTPGWLEALVRCMQSDAKIGIAGPLSNAGGYQNVPRIRDEKGDFEINESELDPSEIAALIKRVSTRSYPRLPVINGFCFMIRREVLKKIGYFDEINYPICYGEEDDFCHRASSAGYDLAVADDAYVRHLKSRTYGNAVRLKLSRQGMEAFERLYSREIRLEIARKAENSPEMAEIRARISAALQDHKSLSSRRP